MHQLYYKRQTKQKITVLIVGFIPRDISVLLIYVDLLFCDERVVISMGISKVRYNLEWTWEYFKFLVRLISTPTLGTCRLHLKKSCKCPYRYD